MSDTQDQLLTALLQEKEALEEWLIENDKKIAQLQGKRYRTPEKKGRSRIAKSNASLSSIRSDIAQTYGLPEDGIVFMEPGLNRKCTTINVGQYRKKWDWEAKPEAGTQ
mgnify:CR=1 FL=1